MTATGAGAWRCSNCGYVHRGPVPPESCPICGAPAEDFTPFEEAAAIQPAAASQWRCLNCNFVHGAATPPAVCPVCRVPSDQFEAIVAVAAPPSGTAGPYKAVVIGAGIAGVSAAEAIRNASVEAEITLIAGEDPPPYYRLNLTRYLAGEITRDVLPIHPMEWYRENRIELVPGVRVDALDLPGRSVSVADRGTLRFDRLVLCTGAHPFIPPIPGADGERVITLRTHEDADLILERALRGDPVVIIGGGVLGLETAGALARRGADVTLLEGTTGSCPGSSTTKQVIAWGGTSPRSASGSRRAHKQKRSWAPPARRRSCSTMAEGSRPAR
jgi:nitrite reductase (NADH) large subunit